MNTLSAVLFLGTSHFTGIPELTTIGLMVKAAFLSVMFL